MANYIAASGDLLNKYFIFQLILPIIVQQACSILYYYCAIRADLKENLRNNDVVSPLAKKVPNELNKRSELIPVRFRYACRFSIC